MPGGPENDLIEENGQNAQDYNAEDDPVHFEDLTAIDDQISEAGFGREEFADDHADQTQADIDLEDIH